MLSIKELEEELDYAIDDDNLALAQQILGEINRIENNTKQDEESKPTLNIFDNYNRESEGFMDDAVWPTVEAVGEIFDYGAEQLPSGGEAFIKGVGRGLGNATAGVSQFGNDMYGQLMNEEVNHRLNSIQQYQSDLIFSHYLVHLVHVKMAGMPSSSIN